jgi:hypothetical protein
MKKMSVFDLYMEFPSPCGDKLQCCRLSVCPVCGKFPSPYGDGTNITTVDSRSDQFSPPYGDGTIATICEGWRQICFRPLTGINCNKTGLLSELPVLGFRPLAGINCNKTRLMMASGKGRFRPLAGINCKYTFIKTSYPIKLVPSPYGV